VAPSAGGSCIAPVPSAPSAPAAARATTQEDPLWRCRPGSGLVHGGERTTTGSGSLAGAQRPWAHARHSSTSQAPVRAMPHCAMPEAVMPRGLFPRTSGLHKCPLLTSATQPLLKASTLLGAAKNGRAKPLSPVYKKIPRSDEQTMSSEDSLHLVSGARCRPCAAVVWPRSCLRTVVQQCGRCTWPCRAVSQSGRAGRELMARARRGKDIMYC